LHFRRFYLPCSVREGEQRELTRRFFRRVRRIRERKLELRERSRADARAALFLEQSLLASDVGLDEILVVVGKRKRVEETRGA